MVGLLWTSDQPVAEASTYTGQHNIKRQETNIYGLRGIQTRDNSNQAAADLRPRGHWNRQYTNSGFKFKKTRALQEETILPVGLILSTDGPKSKHNTELLYSPQHTYAVKTLYKHGVIS
jgi:hypothetical protein